MNRGCISVIEVVPETDLTPVDEAQIADILRASFPTDFEGRSFYQQRPHMRVLWREDRVLAQISVFLRAIRVGDTIVDVVGIGDVATAPDSRGCGLASALLDRCIQVATDSRADFLILFGDRTLYDRAGFVPASNRFRYIKMVGARTGEVVEQTSPFLRVLPLSAEPWQDTARLDFLGHLF